METARTIDADPRPRTGLKQAALMLLVGTPLFVLGTWVGELGHAWIAFTVERWVLSAVGVAGLVLIAAGAIRRRPLLVLATLFAWMSFGAGLLGGKLSYRIAIEDCSPSIYHAERAIHAFEQTHGRWPTGFSELGLACTRASRSAPPR